MSDKKLVRAYRGKAWVFTLNNPLHFIYPDVDNWGPLLGVTYVVWQHELGPSGTLHYQGYLELVNRVTLKQLKKLPGLESAHFEGRRGSQAEAIAYCQKADTRVDGPYSWGEPAPQEQGRRSDLLAVKESVDAGHGVRRLFDDHFPSMVRYGRGIMQYMNLVVAPRDFPSFVLFLVGPSGTGKSTTALLLGSLLGPVYSVPARKGSGLYFDGYDPSHHSVMLIDEMDGNRMTPDYFNLLCSPQPCTLPVHQSAGLQMRSRYIIICSNYLPRYWWKNRSVDQVRQTTRRIHVTFPFILSRAAWRLRHPSAGARPSVAVSHGDIGAFHLLPPFPSDSEILKL